MARPVLLNKPVLLKLHRYVGLAMALFLLVQAVTGAMLVYRADVARWIDPAGMVRQTAADDASLQAVVGNSQAALPGFSVTRLYFPDRADGVYFLELASADGAQLYATVDPGNGRLLRKGGLIAFPVQAALRLHYQFNLGPVGAFVIFLNGCALLFLSVMGLLYWWPRGGAIRRSLMIRRGLSPWVLLRQLHRIAGVLAAMFLIVISVTGLVMAWQDGQAAFAPRTTASAAPLGQLEQAISLASLSVPGAALRDARLSAHSARINFFAPAHGPRAVHQVVVDLRAMKVSSVLQAKDNPALWMVLLPIHSGDFGGLPGRILFTLVALILAGLAVSGPLLWWQRRPAKGAK